NQYQALAEVFAGLLGRFEPPAAVTDVTLFASCSRVADLVPNALGFATRTRDLEQSRMFVSCESLQYSGQVLLHELTHVFAGYALGSIPLWLNEGLAKYLESVVVEEGATVVGRPDRTTQALHGHAVTLPTLDRLLGADARTFYHASTAASYYVAARGLVGTFMADQRDRFLRYLPALATGPFGGGGGRRARAGRPLDDLAESARTYHTRPAVPVWRLPHHAVAAAPAIERMRPGAVHAMWIEMQLVRGVRGDVQPPRARLAAAPPQGPPRPRAQPPPA